MLIWLMQERDDQICWSNWPKLRLFGFGIMKKLKLAVFNQESCNMCQIVGKSYLSNGKSWWVVHIWGKKQGGGQSCMFCHKFGTTEAQIWKFPKADFFMYALFSLKPFATSCQHTPELGFSLKCLGLYDMREKKWKMFVKICQNEGDPGMTFWKTSNLH